MECDKCITAVYITIDINAVNNVMFNLLTLWLIKIFYFVCFL
jgi:hypothetical protein